MGQFYYGGPTPSWRLLFGIVVKRLLAILDTAECDYRFKAKEEIT